MTRQSIRNEGEPAEVAFSKILGEKVKPSDDSKKGDRQFFHQGQWHYVEIKHCQSNTVNQVRAIKCTPLVVFSPDKGERCWAVLSARLVAKLIARKRRGQHTEIPFECANLTRSSLPDEVWCTGAQLDQRLQAALDDPLKDRIKSVMNELLAEIRSLRDKYCHRLRSLLSI